MNHAMQVPDRLRQLVYRRDGYRCVICDSDGVTIQRRQASGIGGLNRVLRPSECVTLCWHHNVEAEGSWQEQAKAFGVKVPRNIGVYSCGDIPVLYARREGWRLLRDDGSFLTVPDKAASGFMARLLGVPVGRVGWLH